MLTPSYAQRSSPLLSLGRIVCLVSALLVAVIYTPRLLKVNDLTLELSPSVASGAASLYVLKNTILHCTAAYQLHAEHIPLDFAQQYCITNPACTAFSVTPAGDISLCESTRAEFKSQSKALSYVKSSCIVRDGVVDCSTAQSGGCYYQQEHTNVCVLDVLKPLIADFSSNSSLRLCHSPREGLVVTENGGKGCEWDVEDWTSLQIRNLHSHALLVPDLLKYSTSGFLQQPRECLCHNSANGLVTGPYCGNQDCLWVETREPGCYYRNRQTQECIGSLLRLEGPQQNVDSNSKYLCLDDGVLYLSSRAHTAACVWYTPTNQTSLVNKATGRLFQEIVQLVGDGSACEVVARATRCLCYSAEHGLRMTDRCTRSCAWLPGGQSLTLEGSPYQATFNHEVQSFRFSCAVQLQPASFLKTATDALAACSSHPMCTYVTYGFRDGRTFLCQGYFKGVTVEDEKNDLWLNAFPGTCQSYNEESAVVAVASTSAPKCRRTSCSCPTATAMVVSCDVRHDAVCDSCPEGYCSVWPNTTVLEKFPAAMKDVSMFGLGPRFRGFNPAIGAYNGQAWVVVRLANNTYCDEYSYQEQVSVFMSHVGLCKLDESTMSPHRESCLLLQVDISSMINHRGMLQHPVFKGIEDPRLFVYNNSLYISGTILLFSTTSRSSNMEYTRVAMFRINAHKNATEWGVYLYEDSSYDRLRQKNWMPIVDSRGKLRFVTSLWPLTIVTPDLATGKCTRTYQGTNNIYEHNAHLLQHHLRGGAPFIRIQSSWLTIVHKRVDYPMGPIYTHYVVVIKDTPSWEVLYVSPGFRLPTLSSAGSVQDIQFAVGMMMKGGDMYVSFGVADCFSALAIMHDFWDTLQLIIERNEMPKSRVQPGADSAHLAVSTLRKQVTANRTIVRWEGPSLDYSSFAIVARSLTQWFSNFGLHVMYYDLANHGSVVAKNFTSLDYIRKGLIRNNIDHIQSVDIAVRLQWPLNLEKTHHAKKLVVYLPWEFYYIPSAWVDKLNEYADDVWVPTNYVKQGFVASGVSPDKVFVLPHGVDKDVLCPDTSSRQESNKALPLGVTTNKTFIFLYESGALWRKGLDVLLNAFNSEFTAQDDVVLLVHTIYGDMEVLSHLEDTVRSNKANTTAAEIIRISAKLSDAEQRLLRDAADVYVMPTRAEGYGLTIAEAMACGLPVITTDQGAHTEFIDESTGLLVKSTRTSCDKYPCYTKRGNAPANVFGLAMDNDPIWFEPDVSDLRLKLRMAYMKPELMKFKATRAREHILKTSKWRDIAKHAAERLHQLVA